MGRKIVFQAIVIRQCIQPASRFLEHYRWLLTLSPTSAAIVEEKIDCVVISAVRRKWPKNQKHLNVLWFVPREECNCR